MLFNRLSKLVKCYLLMYNKNMLILIRKNNKINLKQEMKILRKNNKKHNILKGNFNKLVIKGNQGIIENLVIIKIIKLLDLKNKQYLLILH